MRNYTIETILEKSTDSCPWKKRGCPTECQLARLGEHMEACEYRPPVVCYFRAISGCRWYGEGEELAGHLEECHDVEPLKRRTLARYLWNPPDINLWRYRFRTIEFSPDSDGKTETYIFEHYYDRHARLLAFTLRDPTGKRKRDYKLKIVSRTDPKNSISLSAKVAWFTDTSRIQDCRNETSTKVLTLPYETIMGYVYKC
jgi:hypothetical protein